jgi:hypothetical protein
MNPLAPNPEYRMFEFGLGLGLVASTGVTGIMAPSSSSSLEAVVSTR